LQPKACRESFKRLAVVSATEGNVMKQIDSIHTQSDAPAADADFSDAVRGRFVRNEQ